MRRLPFSPALAASIALLAVGLTAVTTPVAGQIRLGNESPLRLGPAATVDRAPDNQAVGDDTGSAAAGARPLTGTTFEDGMGAFLEGDFERISSIWQPLALAGDVEAQRGLGIVYRDGVGTAANPAAAARWFRRAATAGDGEAQIFLVDILRADGGAVEAADWARRAAEQGIPRAQFILGQMYQSGEGVPVDPVRAAIWYERAATAGSAEAQLQLGLMFRDGLGIQANPARAARLLDDAAAKGRVAPPEDSPPVRLGQQTAPAVVRGGRSLVAANTVDGLIRIEPLGPLPLADQQKLDDREAGAQLAVVDRVAVSPSDLRAVAADLDGPGGIPTAASPAGLENLNNDGLGGRGGTGEAGAEIGVVAALTVAPLLDAADTVSDEPAQVTPELAPDAIELRQTTRRRDRDGGPDNLGAVAAVADEPVVVTPAPLVEPASRVEPARVEPAQVVRAPRVEPAPQVALAPQAESSSGPPVSSGGLTRAVPRIPPAASRQRRASSDISEPVIETARDQVTSLDAAAVSAVASEFAIGLSAFGVGDYDTARDIWEPLAGQDDARYAALAHLGLGWLDEGAGGGRADFAAAAGHYDAAATLGFAEGFFRLSLLYAAGRGIDLDPRRAERLRRRAVDAALDREPTGLTVAAGGLLEVQPDTSSWLTRSLGRFSRKGSALSRAYLLSQQGMDQDAVAIWQELAAKDVAVAQFALARAADTGRGLAADPATAMAWLQRAADAGYGPAMHNLGVRLLEGRGIDADPRQAAAWFERAADAGVASAQHMLGLAHISGSGVEENLRRAKRLLEDALAGGVIEARLGLAAVYLRGERENTDPLVALGHLETAARSGSDVAQAALGLLLARGMVIEANMPLALAWLERASQNGNLDAQYHLGVLGVYGRAEDLAAGYQWLNQAADGGLTRAQDLRDAVQDRVPRSVVEQAEQVGATTRSSL